MFGSQALRLLRENWPNSTMLAQELYAIFDDTNPTSSGPIVITNNGKAGPGLTVKNPGGGDTYLRFGGGETPTDFTLGPDGGLIIQTPSLQTQAPGQSPVSPGGGGGDVPGQVLSGGPGNSYQVQIYPNGLAQAHTTVAATQLSIDPAETIPAGTWTLVAKAGANYYLQVPVWGAP